VSATVGQIPNGFSTPSSSNFKIPTLSSKEFNYTDAMDTVPDLGEVTEDTFKIPPLGNLEKPSQSLNSTRISAEQKFEVILDMLRQTHLSPFALFQASSIPKTLLVRIVVVCFTGTPKDFQQLWAISSSTQREKKNS
jgi:hypothetical protein